VRAAHAPLGDALRANLLAEDAAVAEQLAADAETRKQLEFERAREREFFGVETRSVADVLIETAVGVQAPNVRAGALSLQEALDIADRREQHRDEAEERRYAEAQGNPAPLGMSKSTYMAKVAAAAAEREATAATLGDVGRLEQTISSLKSKIYKIIGKLPI
jgi:hypothetical protein